MKEASSQGDQKKKLAYNNVLMGFLPNSIIWVIILSSPDVIARGMVADLEVSLNNEVLPAPRGAGYDVLVKSGRDEKHIEAKGIKNNDTFFAVNGLAGIHKLLFDAKYCIYFCDVETAMILVTNNKFIQTAMGWSINGEASRLINSWLELAYSVKNILKVTVDGRIRFHIFPPIRTITASLQNDTSSVDGNIRNTIVALWRHREGIWEKLYP